MHKYRSIATVAAVVVGALFGSSSVSAQSSGVVKTKGLMIGAHLNGSAIKFGEIKESTTDIGTGASDEWESGGGGGVVAGWGFTKWFMIYGGIDVAKVKIKALEELDQLEGPFDLVPGDYLLSHADLGARFSLPSPNHGFVPYANLAVSARVAAAEVLGEEISMSGPGLTVGAGLQYFFNPKLALDASIQFTAGKFTEAEALGIKVDLDKFAEVENSNSARINIGMRFYPHFGRK